jgi:hypothetical protein
MIVKQPRLAHVQFIIPGGLPSGPQKGHVNDVETVAAGPIQEFIAGSREHLIGVIQ